MIKNDGVPSNGCSCAEYSLNCSLTNTTSGSNTIVSFQITPSTQNYGFCTLKDGDNNIVTTIAIVDELSITPSEGFITGTTSVNLTSTPALSTSQFNDLLTSPKIVFKHAPSVNIAAFPTDQSFVFDQFAKNNATEVSPTISNDYEVELVLQDSPVGVSAVSYPIFQPFVLFGNINTTSITPALVTVGYKTKIQLSGTNFVTGSGTVDFKFKTSDGTIHTVVGNVIHDKLMEVEYTFPIGTKSGITEIEYSFDDKNSYQKSNLNLYLFVYPSNLQVTYTNATFPEEVGCSTFGDNQLSLNLYSEVPVEFRDSVILTIYDTSFTLSTNCSWNNVNQRIDCNCPIVYEMTLQLPHSFSFKLTINGKDAVTTQLAISKPVITYFKPRNFIFEPSGKVDSDIALPLTITGFENLFSSSLTYKWFLRNKKTTTDIEILPTCTKNDVTKSFTCSDMTFLSTTSGKTLTGTVKGVSKTFDFNTVCGCQFITGFDLCKNGTILKDGNCCKNETSIETCYTPCTEVCELYPMVRIGNGIFESSIPFHFYPSPKTNILLPNSILNEKSVTMIAIGGPFISGELNIEFRPLLKDSFAYSKYEIINGTIQNITSSHINMKANNIKFINSTAISFSNPIISHDVGYEIYITNNNDSWSLSSDKVHFRSYVNDRFKFTQFLGDSGIGKTTPGGSKFYLEGNGFYPTSRSTIIYNISSGTSNGLSFENTCEFINGNNISCNTNNVFKTGVSLPLDFDVYFSINGIDYVNTNLKLSFLKSEIPVIVQLIPATGPINPDSDYSVTVKGVTKNIDSCVWISKTSQTSYTTTPPTLAEDQIDCPTPVKLLSAADKLDYGTWQLYLKNSKTLQESLKVNYLFYANPRITTLIPLAGDAFGGHIITLVGTGFLLNQGDFPNQKLSFRLDKTISNDKCIIYNNTHAGCIAPPNPQRTNAKIAVSFNENQFYEFPSAGTPGIYDIEPCAEGFSALNFETKCEVCERGTFKPVKGFFDCIPCQAGSYGPNIQQVGCTGCPGNTISKEGSINITDCDCKPNFYRTKPTSGIECLACVEGGVCLGGVNKPYPQPGWYWKKTSELPYDFIKCLTASFCTGNVTNGQEGCIEGRTGLLCEECAQNYFKSSGKCEKCNTEVQWRMILVIVALFVLILIFFKFAQLKVSHLSSFSIAVSYYQIIAVFSAYNFKWPDALKTVLGYMKFLNLDLDIFVPECISVITYAMKWAATICIPLMFGSLLFLGFMLEVIRSLFAKLYGKVFTRVFSRLYYVNRQNWMTKQASLIVIGSLDFFARSRNMKEIGEFADKCIHTFVIVISFSYVFVVTKAAQIFNCSTIDKELKMVSETSVTCYQGDWWIYFPFAIITLLTFGLGVIALFGYILLFKKKIQADKRFNARFRFLFVRFRDEKLYWEIIIILRKLFISIAIIFFSGFPMLVVLFSLFIIFVAFILQTHQTPFRRPFHNLMEYVVLLSTLVLLFCALLFYVDEFPYQWSKDFLGVLCVFVIVASSIFIGLVVILDFLKQFLEDTKPKSRNQLQLLGVDDELDANALEMKEQDLILSKYGLTRRINQTTVIVGENGDEIVKTYDPNDDEKVEQQTTQDVKQQQQQVQQIDIKGSDVELPDISIQDIQQREQQQQQPSLNQHERLRQLQQVQQNQSGIAEIPDDE